MVPMSARDLPRPKPTERRPFRASFQMRVLAALSSDPANDPCADSPTDGDEPEGLEADGESR